MRCGYNSAVEQLLTMQGGSRSILQWHKHKWCSHSYSLHLQFKIDNKERSRAMSLHSGKPKHWKGNNTTSYRFFFLEYERIPPNSFIMINAVVILKAEKNSSRKSYINTEECKSGIFAVKILNENSIKIKWGLKWIIYTNQAEFVPGIKCGGL